MTDATSQHVAVIAKDLLIAALETKQITLGGSANQSAKELGSAYKILLDALQARTPFE